MKKAQKRQKIRGAATNVFAEKGFENTTTREIAVAADISAAALYYYFDSKEDLLYQILDETMNTGLELIKEIEKNEKSLKEKLSDVLHIHTRAAVDYNKMKLLVHEQNSLSPLHKKAIIEKQKEYIGKLRRILEDLKGKGEILDLDTKVCAFAFFGMVSWAYRWYRPEGKIKPAELSDIFKQIFTRGVFK